MTLLLLGPVSIAILTLLPYGLKSLSRYINAPQAMGSGYLFAIIGWVVVPTAWLMCAVGSLVEMFSGHQLSILGCELGFGSTPWNLSGYILGLLLLIPFFLHTIQGVRLTLETQRNLCQPTVRNLYRSFIGGTVNVVNSDDIDAASVGFVRTTAQVTTGTLALLTTDEQYAVLEHEAAHLRLGHTRLLFLGSVFARVWFFLPPVREAWSGLTREIEVAADNETRKVTSPEVIISALAKVVSQRAKGSTALGFGGSNNLRYRIQRLQNPLPSSHQQVVGAVLGLVFPVIFVTVSSCLFTTHSLFSPGLLGCGLVVSAVMYVVGKHHFSHGERQLNYRETW